MIFPACILFTVCRMNIAESSPDRSATGTDTCTESFFAIAVCIFLVDLQETIRQVVIINTIMILIVFVIVSGYWFPVTCSRFLYPENHSRYLQPINCKCFRFPVACFRFLYSKSHSSYLQPRKYKCSLFPVTGFRFLYSKNRSSCLQPIE